MNLKRTPRWLFVALGLMLLPAGLAAQVASGSAQVIDGRTLVIKGKRFMLHGIDVPDLAQSCTLRGRPVRCGLLSRWALMDLVAGARVRCALKKIPPNQNDKPWATCSAGGADVGANMIHTGWAVADAETAPAHYRALQQKSRTRRWGLWRTSFVMPRLWRQRQAERSQPAATRGGKPKVHQPAKGETCRRGRLLDIGVECQAFRGDDKKLYTLTRHPDSFENGDRVCVCGRPAQISICMQGTTITPSYIGKPETCPSKK